MKKLQSNFTTPEQSKRLLMLGVPADSADCYWNDICGKPIPMQQGILYSDKRNQFRKVNVPVWSAGRLIEIIKICKVKTIMWELMPYCDDNIRWCIDQMDKLDFSKLED